MITNIVRRVCLESKYMDSNIMDHLLQKIRKITHNECSKDYGYILGVNKITSILDNRISSANSDNVFTVEFEAHTLKPEEDKEFGGKVCMIFPQGIFLDIEGKLKALIPLSALKEYTLNRILMCYEKDDAQIKKGDDLTIRITKTQYSDQNFSCFGELVEA